MEDPQDLPRAEPSEDGSDRLEPLRAPAEPAVQGSPVYQPEAFDSRASLLDESLESRRRTFRRNLYLLFSFSLAAFILTAWILVRVDEPFGMSSSAPQNLARAQLRALDQGQLRPAYDMFSRRYRQQVSFDLWRELVSTHWRMFHAEVVRASEPSQDGPRVTLEMHLHGADAKDYRARYTLIRLEGRWWIDDVHWAEEASGRDFSRT